MRGEETEALMLDHECMPMVELFSHFPGFFILARLEERYQ
jgi:hypothetical protein